MKPYYQDDSGTIYCGDCRNMAEIPDESIHCVPTSPPYWGLRKYEGQQELIWGGDPECQHEWATEIAEHDNLHFRGEHSIVGNEKNPDIHTGKNIAAGYCHLCGATKCAFGLEKTPEMYVQHTIEILREIKRVLRKDGVVFWNIGDSYMGSGQSRGKYHETGLIRSEDNRGNIKEKPVTQQHHDTIKPLDLCLIPDHIKIAAQEDGWWVRSVIIWNKPNPMPESVRGWTFVRHRVTIKEYERLQSLRSAKSGDQDRATNLPRLSQSQISDSQEALSAEQEGQSNGKGKGKEARCQGEEASIQSLSARQRQSKEIYADREGAEGRNIENGALSCETGKCGGDANSRGMVGDSGEEQPPLLLLQEEKLQIDNRPCNSTEQGRETQQGEYSSSLSELQQLKAGQDNNALIDCPGCEKCLPNDGYILRKGSWRPTSSYEFILMLTKSDEYYCDADAVRELQTSGAHSRGIEKGNEAYQQARGSYKGFRSPITELAVGRNLRDVWTFPTMPYPKAHFAVFPEKLPELCIKAATSEKGCCPKCGAPWARVTEISRKFRSGSGRAGNKPIGKWANQEEASGDLEDDIRAGLCVSTKTLGWRPTCNCGDLEPIPCTVLDPFMGTGTTLWVAKKLERRAIGYDISGAYCKLAVERNRQTALIK